MRGHIEERKPVDLETGWWFRFSAYEIADGYIRPARGAKAERYRFDDYEFRDSDGRRPYESLAEILWKLRFQFEVPSAPAPQLPKLPGLTPRERNAARREAARLRDQMSEADRELEAKLLRRYQGSGGRMPSVPGGRYSTKTNNATTGATTGTEGRGQRIREASGYVLMPESEEGLLRWCQQFGLLGVLLQRVETVVFAPRPAPHANPRRSGASQDRLYRTPMGWQLAGRTTSGAAISDDGWAEPGVMLHGLSSFELSREPITQTWSRFFPTIDRRRRETYPYPPPGDEAFFSIYAEPVEEFIRAAGEFVGALDVIGRCKAENKPDFGALRPFASAVHTLNGFAATSRRLSWPMPDGTLRQLWIAPTLLATMATLALHDLEGGQEIRRCENHTCAKLYVSAAYQSRYCSKRCRYAVNKRAFRRDHPKNRAKPGTLINRGRTE
jgi:hypothetical protein